jgi:hypothetical protein
MARRTYILLGLVEVREQLLMLASSAVLMLQGFEVYPIRTFTISLHLWARHSKATLLLLLSHLLLELLALPNEFASPLAGD